MQIIGEAAYTFEAAGDGLRQALALATIRAETSTTLNTGDLEVYNTGSGAVRIVRASQDAGVHIPAGQGVRVPLVTLANGLLELLGEEGATAEVVIWGDPAGV